tara:strand:- start:596 stop:703 length:108 start_codon:yes stop_codon:yes gene_type:complete
MKELLLAFLDNYQKAFACGEFYEEPLSDDFLYPDW